MWIKILALATPATALSLVIGNVVIRPVKHAFAEVGGQLITESTQSSADIARSGGVTGQPFFDLLASAPWEVIILVALSAPTIGAGIGFLSRR